MEWGSDARLQCVQMIGRHDFGANGSRLPIEADESIHVERGRLVRFTGGNA